MNVKRLLTMTTTCILVFLIIAGFFYQDIPLMWFASSEGVYQFVRVVLIITLICLISSRPPRSIGFRIILASIAFLLAIGTIGLSLNYGVEIIDAFIFTEVAIIFMLESLESDYKKVIKFTSRYAVRNQVL